ncbi:MAG: substrate-binding domain-containing protein, partial [Anaerolineales bacterium]|nr:substrate-binding domain-containing protein [Anaerolineales bacterium]
NRSHVLGVIVRRIVDPFFAEVLHGIEDVLHTAGYGLFLAASHRDPERERQVMQAMGERRVDGVIISSAQISPEQLRRLDRFDVPFVLINNQALDEPDIYAVYHDDAYGCRQITQYLLGLGHRRIAYLGNERGGRTNVKRQQGYEAVLQQAELPLRADYITLGATGTPEGGAEAIKHLLALDELPTAVICYNDMMAVGAIQAIHQAGLRVPNDISITGFDDVALAAYITPPLTTFHQPQYELGHEAAAMMLRVLNNDQNLVQPEAIVLHGELVVRQSTIALKR